MVKYRPREIKDSNHELAIAIKKNYQSGMKPKNIAKLFHISKQRINYIIHHSKNNKKKRRSKLTRNEKMILIKWARDKPINIASARKLQKRFNSLPKSKKENKLQKKISLTTVNKTLNKYLSTPKQIKKVFFLSSENKKKRLKFLKFMKENKINPHKIFFTDESNFNVTSYLNRNYRIRLCKKTLRSIKQGNEIALKKVTRQYHKKVNGILVSGGICREGLGRLIFHSGTVNSFAYKQVLNFYKEDMESFPDKYFQQDGARVHSSKSSQEEIKRLFGEKFIPTWENASHIKGKEIPQWPPNFPDLSPIELIWSIIKGMLNIFQPSTINELKISIHNIWNSIASNKKICEKIIQHTEKRWNLCIKHNGRRLDKQLLRKIKPEKDKAKLKVQKSIINGVRISYNDKFLEKLKNKDIKDKKKKLKEQIAIEKQFQTEFERLMKLKPREYKNIPDKVKQECKFNYEHEKARKEYMQDQIEQLEKMTSIEYLNLLNDEMKQKLIGLCLDRKILEAFENDSYNDAQETMIENNSDDLDNEEEEEESEELE